ncbi:PHO85 cyclin-1 [Choanephora cucurbitarum]|uniref:PHO85 cyclin-1 n=1 Tax=Choanephora cucurbitarum TaxID=101091 RepID=A0A1C7NEH0_9FUNG|nr:PHO85 cyclin-1 [Choanephora cucurbitarum]
MMFISKEDRILFDQISRENVTSYILDFVSREYEAIIYCPPSRKSQKANTITQDIVEDYFSNKKKKDRHYKSRSNFDHSGLPSPPLSSSPERKSYRNTMTPTINYPPTPPDTPMPLRCYIESVVKKSGTSTGTLLTSLAYARRLRAKLSRTSKGMECTHHRIFLATLIVTSKYIHDSAIKNKYWVRYALQFFSASEINLMEKQLLHLLDYQLGVSPLEFDQIICDTLQLDAQYRQPGRSFIDFTEQAEYYYSYPTLSSNETSPSFISVELSNENSPV